MTPATNGKCEWCGKVIVGRHRKFCNKKCRRANWRKNNPEKVQAHRLKWRTENPESVKASRRKSYLKCPEYYCEYAKQYRADHPGRAAETLRRWRKKNPEKAKELDKRWSDHSVAWRKANRAIVNERNRKRYAEKRAKELEANPPKPRYVPTPEERKACGRAKYRARKKRAAEQQAKGEQP